MAGASTPEVRHRNAWVRVRIAENRLCGAGFHIHPGASHPAYTHPQTGIEYRARLTVFATPPLIDVLTAMVPPRHALARRDRDQAEVALAWLGDLVWEAAEPWSLEWIGPLGLAVEWLPSLALGLLLRAGEWQVDVVAERPGDNRLFAAIVNGLNRIQGVA